MKGIYLINERPVLTGLSREESILMQETELKLFLNSHNIEAVTLNSNQLNSYYTIPHALLYDLRLNRVELDYLIIHSYEIWEDFIFSYPARWLILKSYFRSVLTVETPSIVH